MIPLLGALLDYDSDSETYARYDAMTSRELFRQYGESGCPIQRSMRFLRRARSISMTSRELFR